MFDRSSRRVAGVFVALAANTLTWALASAAASAQDDRWAPENKPAFSYPSTPVDNGAFSPQRPPPWPADAVAEGPFDLHSYEQRNYRVSVAARGLVQPRSLQFLPSGDILVTELAGRLRLVRDGVLQEAPVEGIPPAFYNVGSNGLRDIALHPDFANNGLVYFTYDKLVWGDMGVSAVWRGRWTGDAIEDGADVWVGDDVETGVSRLEFGPDGKLYVTVGGPANGEPERLIRAQHPDDYAGKTLRLNDDGTIPEDNPFIGQEGYNPEIFTLGHRNQLGLTINPWTNELWASEQGPNGGDEVNILGAGKNYGWPLVSDGRHYLGPFVSETQTMEGMERAHVGFIPSPALGGLTFYTGDEFPSWQRNLFVASLQFGETPHSGHLIRVVFNEDWQEVSREMLLTDLHQRIRDVVQGPDGFLYVITAENDGVLLRIEPLPDGE